MKLGDYGLQVADTSNVKGRTILYNAPEAFNKTELKSDVWSFGITMYELAEGKNPFEDIESNKVKAAICDNEPPSFSSEKWSADFMDFVSKCLVKNVKERPSVSELMNVSDYDSD